MPVDSVRDAEDDTYPQVGSCVDEAMLQRLAVDETFDYAELAAIKRHADACPPCVHVLGTTLARRGDACAEELAEAVLGRSLVKVGDVVGEKYRVEAIVGSGEVGTVVRARHLTLGTTVAIKLIRPNRVGDASARRRLIREARAASALRSDHAVRVVDIELQQTGTPYIVMEYLDGSTLARHVAEQGPLDQGRTVDLVVQVLEAVCEAHAAGIVHRDLTPENLFLTKSGSVKVLDFGLSKTMGHADGATTTNASVLVGSPHYMSPERIGSPANVDARTDVWSLGAVMFFLLTGRPPFDAPNVYVLTTQILVEDAPRVTSLRPAVSSRLDQIVARCLTRNADERFQTAAQLRDALESLQRELGRKFVATLKSEEELAREASKYPPVDTARTEEMAVPPDHEAFDTLKDEPPGGRGQTVQMPAAAPVAPTEPSALPLAVQPPMHVQPPPPAPAPVPMHYSGTMPGLPPPPLSPAATSASVTWILVLMVVVVALVVGGAFLAKAFGVL